MAWSAPVAFATLEIPPAAKLNTIQDNLTYLHGDAGAVSINNTLQINAGGASQNIVLGLSGAAGSFAGLSVGRTASESHFAVPGATNQFFTGTQAGDMLFKIDDNSKNIVFGGTAMRAMLTNLAFGLFTTAPQGALHAVAQTVGGAALGGVVLLAAPAVSGTLQTLTAASLVTRGATFLVLDRNNTGGAMQWTMSSGAGAPVTPGNVLNLTTNTDICQVGVSAGGAITAQRTTGTSGTHDLTIFAFYQ